MHFNNVDPTKVNVSSLSLSLSRPSLYVVNNACFLCTQCCGFCGVDFVCVCVQRLCIHVGELFIPHMN